MHKTSKWAQIVIHANGYISILYAWHYIALSFAVFCCKALGCVASCCAMLCCVLSRCTVLRTLSVCLSGCQSTYLYICLSFTTGLSRMPAAKTPNANKPRRSRPFNRHAPDR